MHKTLTLLVVVAVAGVAGCDDGGQQTDECADVSCSGHGDCAVIDGEARCLCDEGFYPSGFACLPDTGGDPIPAADMCTALVQFICDVRPRCCPDAAGEDFETCRASRRTECELTVGTVVTDPRTGYDEEIGREVLNEAYDLAETCDLAIWDWMWNLETGFWRCLTGTIPPGSSCAGDGALDWVRYYTCVHPNTCRVMDRGVQCTAMSASGEACRLDWDCESGTYCRGATLITDGTCEPQLPGASACERHTQCESIVCDETTTSCGERDANRVWCEDVFAMLDEL